ncbi:hypothetical protein LSAT2_027656, partial [Lamellibrachia satsuma]
MYTRTNMSTTFNYPRGVANQSMRDVYLQHAHRKEDMIASHEDFQETVTDAGVCYTFNARNTANSTVNATGVKNGLELVVNIEQYEYMQGPHNAVGLKFLLHHQDAIPLVQDFGSSVPAGMQTFVAVSVSKETNLPPPHGECVKHRKLRYFDHYSQAACYRECMIDFVVETCGCVDYYMLLLDSDEPPVCNVSQYTSCLLPAIKSFDINMPVTCVCPKECDIVHYKASMSYAAANNNKENRFDFSKKYLNNVGKHLNESLDTQERLLPDRRQTNIEEIQSLLQELKDPQSLPNIPDLKILLRKSYQNIIELGFHKMQHVLHNRFVVGLDEMNLHDCMSDSFELSKTLRDSVDMIDNECLRTAVRLRLMEKITVSKKVLCNLDRVHDAYCNVVPLTNYTVTPNGSYDSFYLTAELFKQSTEMNETHTRLKGHVKKYIQNIELLFQLYTDTGYEIQAKNKVLNYTNGFWLAAVEYDRDLKEYESFLLRQPRQRIITASYKFEDYKAREIVNIMYYKNIHEYGYNCLEKAFDIFRSLDRASRVGKIEPYLRDLKTEKNVSKLHFAGELTSGRITRLVDNYTILISRAQETVNKMSIADALDLKMHCECCFEAAKEPLLRAFFARLFDHYKSSNASKKAIMRDYFRLKDDGSYWNKLVRGDIGGSMGLLIGASVITLFEAVDAFAITLASRRRKEKRRPRRSSNTETENELVDM